MMGPGSQLRAALRLTPVTRLPHFSPRPVPRQRPFPVRIPVGLPLHHVVQVHVLRLAERIQPLLTELTPDPAPPHPPERARVVVGERVVDPEGPRLDLLHR